MSDKERIELEEQIQTLIEEDEPQIRTIKVKQAKPDDRVKVNILPNHEQIIWVLRGLDKDDFEQVIKAAKQYRKADRLLNNI